MAILSHWGENVFLFMFDPDEFVAFTDRSYRNEFDTLIESQTILSFERPSTVCVSCAASPDGRTPEKWVLLTATGRKGPSPKVGLFPDNAFGAACHFASETDGKRVSLNKTSVILVHVVNAFHKRERAPENATVADIADFFACPL